jgi:hypothetical protein
MENNYNQLLHEIEEIIAKIGNYDIGKLKLSDKGRFELTQLFRKKIKMAKILLRQAEMQKAG